MFRIEWQNTESKRAKELLSQNADIWFPRGFGFDSFSLDQVRHATTDPVSLQFRLNKVRGRGILYGIRHTALRRALSNIFPDAERTRLWQQRLQTAGIWNHLQNTFHRDTTIISDIGMGHTVLHIHAAEDAQGGIVLKQEELPHHRLFYKLLQSLGWANISSEHILCQGIGWQITPYISGKTVSESAYFWPKHIQFSTLAKFAALGDLLGREDRHNENYILEKTGCLPIDTAVLYGQQNESWLFKYVAGGLYEISTLAPYLWQNPTEGNKLLNQFLDNYTTCHHHLANIPLWERVAELTPKNEQKQSNLEFIKHRQTTQYSQDRIDHYKSALAEMLRRMAYRKTLDSLWNNAPQQLNAHPTLKMYALAHESRLATFFLAEERPWIFDSIQHLATKVGIGPTLKEAILKADTVIETAQLSIRGSKYNPR
jgi:hypothetical protein